MTQFANRHQVQEHLASLATQGAIVEIGCGYGNGVIALDKGNVNKLPIYSIDPYLECSDMCGGHYDITTKAAMLENTQNITFIHIEKSAQKAAKKWDHPIGLLWIDISISRPEVQKLAKAWLKFIVPGGYLAITGLDHKGLERDELEFPFTRILDDQDKVMVWQK